MLLYLLKNLKSPCKINSSTSLGPHKVKAFKIPKIPNAIKIFVNPKTLEIKVSFHFKSFLRT
ncbi:Uncharacterised protein [Mesomycoplasma hyorhinis]|nr:Uncharacterised protein [Mesomycoplasma hyorhinis]